MVDIKHALTVFFITVITLPVSAQEGARGTVYLDANKNGVMDSGEAGIADVAVSNGQDVTVTDERGRYSVSMGKRDDKIFVIKPAGYQHAINEKNLPQFYYLHKPDGSPTLNYEGVEATGELPKAVNFPLWKKKTKGKFKVLIFGDPQPKNKKEVGYFDRDIVSEVNDPNVYEFGISLGDLVSNDLDLFDDYNQSISKMGIPWYNVYGNHDMNFDARQDRYADETFEAYFGPATYSFNYGKVHFIILDDVIYPRQNGKSGYNGGLTDRQIEFVENDLKYVSEDHLIVLAFHIPFIFPGRDRKKFRMQDQYKILDLLKDYSNVLSISAHSHVQGIHYLGKNEGWNSNAEHTHFNVGATCGDWWSDEPDDRGIPTTLMRDGTPNGYAVLNIDRNNYTIDYKVAGQPKDYKMAVWGPKVVAKSGWAWHKADLYVNYFLGDNKTLVEYKLPEDNNWRKMNKVDEQDPYAASIREKWDRSETLLEGIRPSNPSISSHLWKAPIYTGKLSEGEQSVQIRVKDSFGRIFKDEYSFKVVP